MKFHYISAVLSIFIHHIMTPAIVLLAITAYFILLLGVSWAASHHRGGNDTFFTGGRQAPWPLVAIATVGASISGVTFISVPGMVAAKGYAYLQMVLGVIVGYAAIAFILVPLFYRNNLVSIYGYLKSRFGTATHHSGAWFFFISKMLGASVRFLVVCTVLQALVFGPWELPFELNVACSVGIVWAFTARGGVKSVIWTDVLKSLCLVLSVALCIFYIARALGLGAGSLAEAVADHPSSRMFFFDDPRSASYFWKQFIAGIFMAIAMNGLDQDMMQRNLACRDSVSSRKNMIVSGVMQFFVIALFLVLGTVMMLLVDATPDLKMPARSDELFSLVAFHSSMPVIVGILFIVGLAAAAWSAAGSALTSLTTSFTVDILGADTSAATTRRRVHAAMATVMGAVIIIFYHLSDQDAISAVYTLASYTYGPILGLFIFGMAGKRRVRDRLVSAVCVAAPVLSWLSARLLHSMTGYETGFELLLFNASFTVIGLALISRRDRQPDNLNTPSTHA